MNLRAADDPADLFEGIEGPLVLVADEITPSVIAQLDWQRLAALVTDAGSWTYHTAILARSIHVPAVAGLRRRQRPDRARRARRGRRTDRRSVRRAGRRDARAGHRRGSGGGWPTKRRSTRSATLPAVTEDGVEIRLEANIESPDDAARALERGAAGIGLFRSEFLLAGSGPGGADRRGAVRRLPAADRERRARPGHDPHVRRQRDAAAARSRGGRRARARRSACAASA